jgi:hypothetical protein
MGAASRTEAVVMGMQNHLIQRTGLEAGQSNGAGLQG